MSCGVKNDRDDLEKVYIVFTFYQIVVFQSSLKTWFSVFFGVFPAISRYSPEYFFTTDFLIKSICALRIFIFGQRLFARFNRSLSLRRIIAPLHPWSGGIDFHPLFGVILINGRHRALPWICFIQKFIYLRKEFFSMKKYRGAIFDLDRTLMDTLADIAGSANMVLEEYGCSTHAISAYRQFVGRGFMDLMHRIFP